MIRRVLVANRGEIACRILRACREAGLSSVAIYAENDRTGMFRELADESVLLEGDSITETYLNGEAIIQVAKDTGADAIHPGFGFLSERAEFAQAVMDAGLIWIGPSPQAIEQMGDKMSARQIMKQAGVPVIPGVEIEEEDEERALEDIRQAALETGYPLLLKATAGGGGKGCVLFMHRKNSSLQHDLLVVKQSLRLEMGESMSKNSFRLQSTLRFKFLQIRMVDAHTSQSVNAVFNDAIRKCLKKHHVLL